MKLVDYNKEYNKQNCPNCGAPISGNICSYCGTRFKVENYVVIPISDPQACTIEAKVAVPFDARRYMSEEDITKFTLNELKNQLAEGLTGFFKLETMDNPCDLCTIVRGRIRVMPPDFRF